VIRIYNVNTFSVARDEEKRKDAVRLPAHVSYSRRGAEDAKKSDFNAKQQNPLPTWRPGMSSVDDALAEAQRTQRFLLFI
jgi:hypothetical protein